MQIKITARASQDGTQEFVYLPIHDMQCVLPFHPDGQAVAHSISHASTTPSSISEVLRNTKRAHTLYIDAILHCHGANLVVFNMWHGIYIYVQSKASIPASTMRRGFHQPPLPLLEEVDLLDPIMKGSCQLTCSG